jgi:LruC domain-containing protein
MKPIHLYQFIAVSFCMILASCIKDNISQIDSTVEKQQLTGTGFNFGNSFTSHLSITFSDLQNDPIANTKIDFYDQDPIVSGSSEWKSNLEPFTSGQTNSQGVFWGLFTVGSTIDTLYAYIHNINYSSPIPVVIKSGEIIKVLHPSGYSEVSKSASRAIYKAFPINYSPWQYTKLSYTTSDNLWVLGNFNSSGYPSYFDGRETESSDFTSAISQALPETKDLTKSTPSLFKNPTTANMVTTAPCQIWVSFLSEGAGYLNTMGYFYYPTNSAPTNISSISKKIVIFPNSSSAGSGGLMVMGDKVRLMYYDESSAQWTDVFPAGITVSWFIISDGFRSGTENSGISKIGKTFFYSIPSFNSDNHTHNVLLLDQTTNKMVIGFDDQTMESGDKDFNDVVFSVTANPISSINTSGMPILRPTSTDDADGDGVKDANDAYPNDPLRAYDSYYPTSGTGTLAFEDQWPNMGDYDFNDLVLGYKYHLVLNASRSIEDVKATYTVNAVGANYKNGFGVQFGTAPGNVASVSGQKDMEGSSLFSLNSVGYENGQSYAVIPVFPDAHKLFGYTDSSPMINTETSAKTETADAINLNVSFGTPVSESSLGTPPYNVFLVVNQNRGREVHLAGQMPTSKASSSFFCTGDDKTNGSTIFYKNDSEFPWALDIPTIFKYPYENKRIDKTYLMYSKWVTSQGSDCTDWYKNLTSGYRNDDNIYK